MDPTTVDCLIAGPAPATGNPDTSCAGCQMRPRRWHPPRATTTPPTAAPRPDLHPAAARGLRPAAPPGGGFAAARRFRWLRWYLPLNGRHGLRRRPGHRRVFPRSPTGDLPVAGPGYRHRPPVQLGPGRSHAGSTVPVHHAHRGRLVVDHLDQRPGQPRRRGQGTETTYNTPDGLTDGETYNIPLQVDASELATGVYPYTMTVTENFGSGDDETSITMTAEGNVNVVNESSDPLGAGWSVGGLQQLAQVSSGGPVLITAGQQGTEAFEPVYNRGSRTFRTWRWRARRGRRSWLMMVRAASRPSGSAFDSHRHRRGRLQRRRRARHGRRQLVDPGDRAE